MTLFFLNLMTFVYIFFRAKFIVNYYFNVVYSLRLMFLVVHYRGF
jgi:hypothetical protein